MGRSVDFLAWTSGKVGLNVEDAYFTKALAGNLSICP